MNPRRCQTGNDRSVRDFPKSIGGLLEVSYYGTATTNCFPAFDGNGNVMALVNAADGTSLANYAYGPFGELIQQTGIMARNNPIRFSTKYQDDESDLLYYGYRYYKPSTGTWPNRDPLGELGGQNLLYGFADNDGINKGDSDGGELIEGGWNMAVDVYVQVTLNVATGKDWYDISAESVLKATALGIVGIPDVGDLDKVFRGLAKSGQISARIEKTASKIPLKSTPANIAKLNERLARQTAERAQVLANAAKTTTIITVVEAAMALKDSAEDGVTTMPGCPNPGYSMNTTVNIVETVTVYLPGAPQTPPPIQINPILPIQ